MHLFEIYERIDRYASQLNYSSSYLINNNGEHTYKAIELRKLKFILSQFEDVPLLAKEIEKLRKSWLYETNDDTALITSNQNGTVSTLIGTIQIGLDYIKRLYIGSYSQQSEDTILIKLPDFQSFEQLSKIANEFKKGIELPIRDNNIQGDVNIVSAEPGSIWLIVSVGSILAVKLIAAICYSAAVIRRKYAEAKIVEAQLKTLDLKNEALQNVIDAQKKQLKNILDSEAEAIANKHYNHKDNSAIEMLKLSLNTVSDLIDRGSRILPSSSNEEIQKSFPDYNALNLIESSIKQIKE